MVWILQNISKKESILLGLLGVSLTTVGVTLLYEFYKKENDNIYDRKRKSSSQLISVELKVPNSTVAAVIGKGGHTIREIEMKTDVTIKLQQFNHNSQDRACTISGPAEGVKLAKIIIQNIIDTVPVIDRYEFYVPYRSVKHILGRGRQNLLKIQETSNAKIIIDDTDFKSVSHPAKYSYGDKDGKKRIVVHGTIEQIEVALRLIEEKVRLEDGAALQDLCLTRVPGAYSKLLTDELPDDLNLAKMILSPLPADDAMEVYVSAMVTPGQFWIQILGSGIICLESLTNEMSMFYDDEENKKMLLLKKINVGDLVAARCEYYNQWYRGEITQILNESQYRVFLLDYGDFIECIKENILELRTDMLGLRLQAVECTLANVKPRNGEWNSEACKQFAACTWLGQSKVMDATVKGYINRSVGNKQSQRKNAVILCVELYDRYKKLQVGQNLINMGFADYKEDTHSKMTDIVTSLTKQQFLSTRLPSKSKTAHAEEGEMNKSVSPPNLFSSIAPRPKKTNEPAQVIATSVEGRQSDVAPEKSTLDINDAKPDKFEPENLPADKKLEINGKM
ncbi:PREDICTED: tudor and KH domain-containing protein-like [Dinoponera quadriceps]|uniref:Tudor and KH domain-containing protein-like n=1 Tax=Dinoponera quadriceps TaxID=609295 RepID=A0A6P3X727_DINQU|nr:PREDICTED: tudor and KH domain-containing protein-like [Dinoponera quadriceps]XP_014474189.1 PREDICTED: tudor and KH domain-containing protein-like [Dinoponera quadriceps]XP_014474190.1 PREDICTED: tudor and KH domain-containing protein-like [Dinoponera quadriceps]XP_014474191.1 PREDICTED: tudor and KH domain-containing protein-like [Dinoponera quadriceps]XP_014474192.1 PREDICTED: tudor and KH domain-containing protein-like [Dinoponera quadriceps]